MACKIAVLALPLPRPRPLLLLLLLAALGLAASAGPSQSSSTNTITITKVRTLSVRPAGARQRPAEYCRDQLARRADELAGIVLVGRVREVYGLEQASTEPTSGAQQPPSKPAGSTANRALVRAGRILKGPPALAGADILVSGYNSSSFGPQNLCPNYVKPNDTFIWLLQAPGPALGANHALAGELVAADRRYTVQGLLSMNLNNLDKVNAAAANEPYKRRPPIEDILCEAHYCPYGRCALLSDAPGAAPALECRCPDSCAPGSAVCGSDNVTYASECHLVREGCRLRRPLFATRESACGSQ